MNTRTPFHQDTRFFGGQRPSRHQQAGPRIKRPISGYAGGMQHRAAERGNTLLIAMVLIMGLTLTGLGVSRLVRNHTKHSSYALETGFPALQALYAAEMGVNLTLHRNNSPTVQVPPLQTAANSLNDVKMTYPYLPSEGKPITLTLERSVNARVTYVDQPTPGVVYRFRSIGSVEPKAGGPTFQSVSHKILFTIRHNGTNWALDSYADE